MRRLAEALRTEARSKEMMKVVKDQRFAGRGPLEPRPQNNINDINVMNDPTDIQVIQPTEAWTPGLKKI